MKIKNVEVNYHRNGIGGEGFHTGFFDWMDKDESQKWKKMFFVIYEAEGHCSVFDAKLLADDNCRLYENSWRGDRFEPELRKAVKRWEKHKYG
jgi:hypothetical protein